MSHAIITQGLGFGDEGKGSVVDALVRHHNSKFVVKYTGGPQCAHRVQLADGRSHIFAQFGSGTFVSGCKTLIGPDVLVNPLAMEHEEEFLQKQGVTDAFDRMYVHEDCIVITPYHRALNKLRELARGDARHGSCGHGVGEVRKQDIDESAITLRVRDVIEVGGALSSHLMKIQTHCLEKALAIEMNRNTASDKLIAEFLGVSFFDYATAYREWASRIHVVTTEHVAEMLNAEGTVIFEGAQGVLLDQDYGFHPYTTWSDCTMRNAHKMLEAANYQGKVTRIGVMRTYMTRHGAGPFVTEDADLTRDLQDAHNEHNDWQGHLRCGWLDLEVLRYALAVNGPVDGLAVTHCDMLEKREQWKVAFYYKDQNLVPWGPEYLPNNKTTGLERQESIGQKC